jgi:tetratricopeptide (TPR) repeat protein
MASKKPDIEFENLRLSWPFAAEHVETSLDVGRIQKHGAARLGRALDIGHVTAFVGSGTSIPYGRLGWRGLVDHLRANIEDKYEKLPEKAQTQGEIDIQNLHKTLRIVAERGDFALAAERYPTLFQITEQLSKLLESRNDSRTEDTFRKDAMRLAFDDREHARRLIQDALELDDTNKKKKSKKFTERFAWDLLEPKKASLQTFHRKFPTPESLEAYYSFLALFSCEMAKSLAENDETPESEHDLIAALSKLVATNASSRRTHLLPLHRFAVPCLALLAGTASRLRDYVAPKPRPIERRAIVPYGRDPLVLLAQELRIRRYLTTNYDLEIERMFEALGYRFGQQQPTAFDDRMNELEERARDFSFTAARAERLIDFATQDYSVEYQVCHLHGRAITGEEDSLVVTERDYDRVYVRNDATRGVVDEAIELAFGGGPLLFIGQGMSEEDLLWPLRQFFSDDRLPADRLAVALLPGDKQQGDRDRDVISYFVRYRIYALHSGTAEYKDGRLDANWLAIVAKQKSCMVEYIDRLADAFGISLEQKRPPRSSGKKRDMKKIGHAAVEARKCLEEFGTTEVEPPLALDSAGDLRSDLTKIDGIEVTGDFNVESEIEVLNKAKPYLLKLAKDAVDETGNIGEAPHRFQQKLKALRLACEGVTDALMSMTICAKLIALSKAREEWRDELEKFPSSREALFTALARRSRGKTHCQKCVRHAVRPHTSNSDAYDEVLPGHLKVEARPARMFRLFTKAIEKFYEPLRKSPIDTSGRRIFLVVGDQGAGKGYFFSEFQRDAIRDEYCRAFGLDPRNYPTMIFSNLSYSAEIASVWDGINDVMAERVKSSPLDTSDLARVAKLRYWLTKITPGKAKKGAADLADQPGKGSATGRTLLVFNAVDVLFDADGFPKNAQIRRIFESLIDERFRKAKLDLIFITDERRIPVYFRHKEIVRPSADAAPTGTAARSADAKDGQLALLERAWDSELPRIPFRHMAHGWLDESLWREFQARIARFRINDVHVVKSLNPDLLSKGDEDTVNGLYFLRSPNAFEHAVNHMTALIVFLGLGGWRGLGTGLKENLDQLSWGPIALVATIFRRIAVAKIAAWIECSDEIKKTHPRAQCMDNVRRFISNPELIYSLVLFHTLITDTKIIGHLRFISRSKFLENTIKGDWTPYELPEIKDIENILEYEIDRVLDYLQKGGDITTAIKKYEKVLGPFAEIHSALRRNRFCTHIFFRAAQQLCIDEFRRGRAEAVFDAVTTWIRLTLQSVSRSEVSRVDETVLAEVLKLYESLDSNLANKNDGSTKAAEHRLQQSLLLHIAVIGQPVEAEVLAQCPEVLAKQPSMGLICKALDQLVDRNLIFEIAHDPRLGLDIRGKPKLKRYSLHRVVRRHVLRRLEGPLIDFSQVDAFSVSLYSIQQRDIARPTAESYRFLSELLVALIGFPRQDGIARQNDDLLDDLPLTARRLRAAYGIVRTVFSVVVVSRFIELERLPKADVPGDGYFARHQQLIQWLLKVAVMLDQKKQSLEKSNQHAAAARINLPFFKEQILWLYNECGMFSLVQGKMHDAATYFDRALRYVSKIEGTRSAGGALDTRVRLNRVVAEIDRGNGRSHLPELWKITQTSDEHPAIRSAALGWIGVIEHLAGDQSAAETNLKEAITKLELLGHMRGASIFHRHLGMLRWQNQDVAKAMEHFRQSEALAEAGGHEDIRQYALLAVVRSEVKPEERKFRPETLQQLQSIENYARTMGVPRLESDVYRSRGYLLLHQGETKLAGQLAEKALEVAILNGLTLRKITAMILLGRTYQARNHPDACKTLLTRASELARRANYQNAVDRAELSLAKAAL